MGSHSAETRQTMPLMDKPVLLITLPLIVIAGFALVRGIPSLVSALRSGTIAELPLRSSGEFQMPAPGTLVISAQGNAGVGDFGSLQFSVRAADGRILPMVRAIVRSSRTSLSGLSRLELGRVENLGPGSHALEISGIDPGGVQNNSRIILSVAGEGLALRIVWVVLAAVALLAAMVFSLIAVFSRPGG